MANVEQDLLTVPEYLRSSPVFDRIRVAQPLVFHDMFCVVLFVYGAFVAMTLYVYFRHMRLSVPQVDFASLLKYYEFEIYSNI